MSSVPCDERVRTLRPIIPVERLNSPKQLAKSCGCQRIPTLLFGFLLRPVPWLSACRERLKTESAMKAFRL